MLTPKCPCERRKSVSLVEDAIFWTTLHTQEGVSRHRSRLKRHKEWRKLAKKYRRKRIRQKLSRQRNEEEEKECRRREQSPSYQAWLEEQRKTEEFEEQEEIRIATEQHERWLKAEEEAKERWQKLQEKLAFAREERAKQTARIKEEWEREQKRLKELKEKKEQEAEEKRKQQEELHQQINNFIENGGDVPEGLNTNFETNPLKPTCPFFSKTGACRFKDTCSRNHIRPGISKVLLIPNFYSHYSLQQTENEHGNDSSLEFENKETYNDFKEFFYDVLPEMESCGYIRQFKVCCNHEIHLRGNVYVEYSSYQEAIRSYQKFHGRWYGGKQLHVEFCSIESWKSAICGLFARQRCPKGSSCNFLHVFRNPGNLFYAADKDLHRTPPSDSDMNSQNGDSEARNWRWSESPERIPTVEYLNDNRKQLKNQDRKSRHNNKKTRDRHKKRRSDSREKCRRKSRSKSRSRSRRRSSTASRHKQKSSNNSK